MMIYICKTSSIPLAIRELFKLLLPKSVMRTRKEEEFFILLTIINSINHTRSKTKMAKTNIK